MGFSLGLKSQYMLFRAELRDLNAIYVYAEWKAGEFLDVSIMSVQA